MIDPSDQFRMVICFCLKLSTWAIKTGEGLACNKFTGKHCVSALVLSLLIRHVRSYAMQNRRRTTPNKRYHQLAPWLT